MVHRISRGFPRRRSSSLKTWGGFTSAAIFTTLAADSTVIVGSFISGADVTVLRTRGLLSIISDQEAADEEVNGAFGLAVVSEDAFAAGAGSVPSPIGDIGSDSWLVWLPWTHTIRNGQSETVSQFPIDSKAMRKFHADERVVVVLTNESTTFGLQFYLSIRQLVSTGAGA